MAKQQTPYRMTALTDIKPYEHNPRIIPQAAVDAVARSIQAFGFRQPIVVDGSGVILAGHTRYKAAKQLGMTEVPVVWQTDITDIQARGYRIADNKVAELSAWDRDAQNDDKELQGFDSYRNYLICRTGTCSCGWRYCEWVGICPHSDESDFDFSIQMALQARKE